MSWRLSTCRLSRRRSAGRITRASRKHRDLTKINPALIGKAGELLVAAELMRRGVEVAHPASDVGVDLLGYKLGTGQKTAGKFVPIQVKAYSKTGYRFLRSWFHRAPGLALVQVWHLITTPQFYVFRDLDDVELAIGSHAQTSSWIERGIWSSTDPSASDVKLVASHKDRWDRIISQIDPTYVA